MSARSWNFVVISVSILLLGGLVLLRPLWQEAGPELKSTGFPPGQYTVFQYDSFLERFVDINDYFMVEGHEIENEAEYAPNAPGFGARSNLTKNTSRLIERYRPCVVSVSRSGDYWYARGDILNADLTADRTLHEFIESKDGQPLQITNLAQMLQNRLEHARAVLEKAVGLFTGTSGRQDYSAAHDLFLIAAETDYELARMWLANCRQGGMIGFSKDAKLANEIARGAIKRVKTKARSGDPQAAYLLGMALCNGLGVRRDDDEGLKWLVRAADSGHAESMRELGRVYASGRHGVQKNWDKAMEWYLKAAEAGHVYAMAWVA